jgi:hypothetical protein
VAPSARSRSRTRSVSVAERSVSPELVDVDEPDVKPDISSPGASTSAQDEDDEMRVKDFKPSVDVTFKGEWTIGID